MSLRLLTAGESHGPSLIAILDGIPADLAIDREFLAREMARRRHGYGRGGRMKIEQDAAIFTGGVRDGRTLGSPIGLRIDNADHVNWARVMGPFDDDPSEMAAKRLSRPRPGHADLAGGVKYGTEDLRNILERASARESAARVAAGAVCKLLLRSCGVTVRSGVLALGGIACPEDRRNFAALERVDEESPLRALDREAEQRMIEAIDRARRAGDTLGGAILVGARGVPAGLGSHVQWDRKLDGRLAQAIVSVPAVKAVEIGDAIASSGRAGSAAHDEIEPDPGGGYRRRSNHAGGLEGGVTNGEDLLLTAFMKPISTLARGLDSVDIDSGLPSRSAYERSDVTAVAACGVICEAMAALVLADALLEVVGGDRMADVLERLERHRERVKKYPGRSRAGSRKPGVVSRKP